MWSGCIQVCASSGEVSLSEGPRDRCASLSTQPRPASPLTRRRFGCQPMHVAATGLCVITSWYFMPTNPANPNHILQARALA